MITMFLSSFFFLILSLSKKNDLKMMTTKMQKKVNHMVVVNECEER